MHKSQSATEVPLKDLPDKLGASTKLRQESCYQEIQHKLSESESGLRFAC